MNGNDLSFLQINVKITNENHRNGIYEEKWHLCDLRKESFTHGAVGRPTLRKTDRFSNHFGKKIILSNQSGALLPRFRSLNVLYKHLDGLELVLGSPNEGR